MTKLGELECHRCPHLHEASGTGYILPISNSVVSAHLSAGMYILCKGAVSHRGVSQSITRRPVFAWVNASLPNTQEEDEEEDRIFLYGSFNKVSINDLSLSSVFDVCTYPRYSGYTYLSSVFDGYTYPMNSGYIYLSVFDGYTYPRYSDYTYLSALDGYTYPR